MYAINGSTPLMRTLEMMREKKRRRKGEKRKGEKGRGKEIDRKSSVTKPASQIPSQLKI